MERYILTTLCYSLRDTWVERADMLDVGKTRLLPLVIRLVRNAPRYPVVVLNGSSHAEQVAATVLRRLRPTTTVILTDCTWKAGRHNPQYLFRLLGVRLMDNLHTHYCVLSTAETQSFARLWRVSPSRVHFTPWSHGLSPEELDVPAPEEPFVFAGGDSMRHYGSLVQAAEDVGYPVFIATRTRPGIPAKLPPNVTVEQMPHDAYLRLMRRAAVVVVALEGHTERSAGQANYLNAMAMGKCVIVTDGTGVRDYVADGKTARVVPPHDAQALAEALRWSLDPRYAAERQILQNEARRVARSRFSPEGYIEGLLRVIDDVLESCPVSNT